LLHSGQLHCFSFIFRSLMIILLVKAQSFLLHEGFTQIAEETAQMLLCAANRCDDSGLTGSLGNHRGRLLFLVWCYEHLDLLAACSWYGLLKEFSASVVLVQLCRFFCLSVFRESRLIILQHLETESTVRVTEKGISSRIDATLFSMIFYSSCIDDAILLGSPIAIYSAPIAFKANYTLFSSRMNSTIFRNLWREAILWLKARQLCCKTPWVK
jgi:hypothetical protein